MYLARNATGRPRLVAPGGSNPVYNDVNWDVLAYEVHEGSTTQIVYDQIRHLTLVQSVLTRGKPLGGQNPSMSFYANYILFDAAAPFGETFDAPHQIYMRYLGPV